MTALLSGLARTVRRAPGVATAAIVLLTLVFGWLAGQQEIQAGFESFASDGEVAQTQEAIDQRFEASSDTQLAQLVIAAPDGDVLSPAGLALTQQILADVTTAPAFQDVAAPFGPDAPAVSTYAGPALIAAQNQGIDPAQLDDDQLDTLYLQAMTALPEEQAAQLSVLLGGDVDGADATAGMLLFNLDATAGAERLSAARAVINEAAGTTDGFEVYTFDFEALSDEINQTVQSEMSTLLGVAFLLIVLILVFVYRTVSDVLTSLIGLIFAVVWSQGMATLLGPSYLGLTGAMTEMSMMIPILLVGLGVDYGIHLTMRSREEKADGSTSEEAASTAIQTVGTALVLATITTVVGFLTNLTNPLPPLKDFGVFAAAGVFAAFVVMATFVPAVRVLIDRRRIRRGKELTAKTSSSGSGALGKISSAIAPTAVHHPWIVLGVGGALALLGTFGATQLSTEFSNTDFFPEDSRALETVEVVTDAFGGGLDETTSVLVEGDLDTVGAMNALLAYHQALGDVDGVRTFQGQPQVDSVITRAFRAGLISGPVSSDEEAARVLDELTASDPSAAGLLTDAYDATVLRVSTSVGDGVDTFAASLDDVEAAVLEPAGLDAAATSENLLIDEILGQLRDSQIKGLATTLIASMLILALVFYVRQRAAMLGVMAIGAVAFATAWVLGVMALTGIPFNVMTAMVSALAIGIGVPYGIHVVNRFVEDRDSEPDIETAMRHTLEHTGGALVGSAVTTIAGFGVLVVSSVPPMKQFGLVTGMTIGLALLSSLVVLPAMLTLWDRRHSAANGREIAPDDIDAPVPSAAG